MEPRILRVAQGFRTGPIGWCDRHLCNVTGNDPAHQSQSQSQYEICIAPSDILITETETKTNTEKILKTETI